MDKTAGIRVGLYCWGPNALQIYIYSCAEGGGGALFFFAFFFLYSDFLSLVCCFLFNSQNMFYFNACLLLPLGVWLWSGYLNRCAYSSGDLHGRDGPATSDGTSTIPRWRLVAVQLTIEEGLMLGPFTWLSLIGCHRDQFWLVVAMNEWIFTASLAAPLLILPSLRLASLSLPEDWDLHVTGTWKRSLHRNVV